ncbi:MAG: DUF87 domain-containing protein [Candidatus Eisenbacteria bacterium]|nr:DUF87 domain-containing protein [Candidatus Eisenbacteria bacterium]
MLARSEGDGDPFWAALPSRELLAQHAWITGGTGAGKSFFVLGCLLQILKKSRHPVIVLDLKGELSDLLIRVGLPALAQTQNGPRLLRRLRIIRPFDPRFVPELRITLPEPGVPREVQAFTIASAIEDALGDGLGIRMNRVFLKLVSLAIEQNQPLTMLQRWLEEPQAFAEAARQSSDPSIRQYAAGAFTREARQSVDALVSRLDLFLFLEQTRLALSAESCVSFADCLDSGLTVISLGDPPSGAERAARFWAGILVGRITRAILSRRLTERSKQTLVLFEEFQEAISGRQSEQFGRLLALARHKKVGLWFINQQVAQLDAALVKLLRTNTGLEAVFRSSFEDAKTIAHALPVATDPKKARVERAALLEEIPRLPNRVFYLWLKGRPFRAQKVRSPRLNLDRLRLAGLELPDDIAAFLEQGTVARPREEIAAALERAGEDEPRRSTAVGFLRVVERTGDGRFPELG